MMSLNIGEARIGRDHNIDRKKSLFERGVRGGIFIAATGAGARPCRRRAIGLQ
jgi:hypothetical protein